MAVLSVNSPQFQLVRFRSLGLWFKTPIFFFPLIHPILNTTVKSAASWEETNLTREDDFPDNHGRGRRNREENK